MNLPKIDLSALPDLDQLTGIFGSFAKIGERVAPGHDDSIVILMTFIYESIPPGTGG